MRTTKQFLSDLAKKFPRDDGRPASDYGLAKLLNVSTPTISKYQNRGGTFDDGVALRVAELLGEKPLYVLACMNAERSKNAEVKKIWAAVAVVVLGVQVALLAGMDIPAADQLVAFVVALPANIHYANIALFLAGALIAAWLYVKWRRA